MEKFKRTILTRYNGQYFRSREFFIRLFLLVMQFGCFMSVAFVIKGDDKTSSIRQHLKLSRDFMLYISIVGFIKSLAHLNLCLLGIIKYKEDKNYKILRAVFDFIWSVLFFCLSIVCADAESKLNSLNQTEYLNYNKGAFGVASVFGFMSWIIYGISGCIVISDKID